MLGALPVTLAHGGVIAECGGSQGHTYILPGNLVPADKAGWSTDSISNGTITLVNDGADFDLIIGDAVGTRSAKADGATVILIGNPANGPVVLAVYPLASETYQFDLANKVVVWTQHKFGTPIEKVTVLQAACR